MKSYAPRAEATPVWNSRAARSRTIALLAAAGGVWVCGDGAATTSPEEPEEGGEGSMTVIASTVGENLDPDGYEVTQQNAKIILSKNRKGKGGKADCSIACRVNLHMVAEPL